MGIKYEKRVKKRTLNTSKERVRSIKKGTLCKNSGYLFFISWQNQVKKLNNSDACIVFLKCK